MRDKIYVVYILLIFILSGCSNGVSQIDKNNKTTKHLAKHSAKKAGVKNSDFLSENALHDAVRANDLNGVKFLISQNVNKDQQDHYGYTPLHLAVRLHNLEIVNYLISQDAEINTIDKFQDTPLLDSTRNNDTNISKVLICNGAYRNVMDRHGMSALHNSSKNFNKYISTLLRADSVEPYCQDELEIDITSANEDKICGNIVKGYAVSLDLSLEDSNGEIYEDFNSSIDNDNNKWCVDMSNQEIPDGKYDISVVAKDYVVNEATDEDKMEIVDFNIAVDDLDETNDRTPQICGTSNSNSMESGEVVLYNMSGKEYGAYKMNINNDESMWCADVNESLPYGNYKIKATALDDTGKEATAPAKLKVQMKQKPLKLNIDEPYQTNDTNPQICGTSNHELDNGIVFLENQYGERYGDYIMQIDNEELRWCADVSDPLPYDDYKVIATAKDPDNRKAFTKSKLKVDEKEGPFTINIDPMDSTSNTMPKICGTSSNKNIRSGVILLEHLDGTKYGYYTMDINRSNSTWCAKVKDRLKYGDYKIEAIALDNKNKQANDNAKTKIKKELSNKKVFVGLYDALMDEFEDDFEPWMAEIDEDSLTFRFKNPTIIFKRAKKDIRREFQLILNDFFPRYIRVLKRYKVQIEYVSVEGHTSSEYRLAKTYAEKYRLNQILSQKRADEVLNHLTNISNPEVMSDIIWILNTFKAQGMSSSQLVYNADGSENKRLSRRVEFRIQAKENSK